jgi:predicted aminopeptidase
MYDDEEKVKVNMVRLFGVVSAGVCAVLFLVALVMFGWPTYRVWQQNKEGEAELARAEQNRQIAIQEARAKRESAKELAEAEVIRAEGIAKANEIIGNSLTNNEAYIHYLWIEALRESKSDVIYIPTEAGIPITESQRFHQIQQRKQ